MNCKPGDLACIVRIWTGEPFVEAQLRTQLIGRFVRVVRLVSPSTWEIAEPIRVTIRIGSQAVEFVLKGIEDFALQPVRGLPVHDVQADEVSA
ncbi:hypothetical protein [Paraburkholderia tropica]|uniref:hypothetical protein n=1 Tax=Paraburkholderia tropica TaxID=92647 RepID=UPI002AB7CFC7|nr:hypothetical protein [Paraburkholderia tropica]